MWDARPITEVLAGVLPLAVVVLAAGLMPSRFEPDSPFFASQRWRYRDVIIVLGAITVSQLVSPAGVTKASGIRLWAINNGATALLIIASSWSVVRWKHRRPWRALGFDPTTAFDNTLWSLRIGLGVVSLLTIFVLVVRLATTDIHTGPSAPPHVVWHGQLDDFVAALVVMTVLGPVAEELFFRGVAYGPLLRKFGRRGASVVSALLWATAHYSGLSLRSVLSISLTLVLGIVYAEVYRRRESLVPAVTFHIVGNATAVFIRDSYLATLGPLAGVSVGLWIVSAVLFHLFSRSRTTATRQ